MPTFGELKHAGRDAHQHDGEHVRQFCHSPSAGLGQPEFRLERL